MHLKNFKDGMNKISKFFNKPLTQDQIEIYYEILREMPDKIFNKAVMDFIETNKFFPTPGEFKEYWRSVEGSQYRRDEESFVEQTNLSPKEIRENFRKIRDLVEKATRDVNACLKKP